MTTEAQLLDIFEGPGPSLSSQDWMLPLWQQPSYPYQVPDYSPIWVDEPAPAPSTSWLTTLSKPFVDFGTNLYKSTQKTSQAAYDKIPELLWGWGLEEAGLQVSVNEGAGVIVTHTQAPHAGGEPAKPAYSIPQWLPSMFPGLFPAPGVPGAAAAPGKDSSSTRTTAQLGLLLGAGIVILFVLFKR